MTNTLQRGFMKMVICSKFAKNIAPDVKTLTHKAEGKRIKSVLWKYTADLQPIKIFMLEHKKCPQLNPSFNDRINHMEWNMKMGSSHKANIAWY